MNISELHDIAAVSTTQNQKTVLEDLAAKNSDPIDTGSVEASAETARKLILAGIEFNVFMHGLTPSQPALKNKIYIAVPQQKFDSAKKISDNVKDLIDS